MSKGHNRPARARQHNGRYASADQTIDDAHKGTDSGIQKGMPDLAPRGRIHGMRNSTSFLALSRSTAVWGKISGRPMLFCRFFWLYLAIEAIKGAYGAKSGRNLAINTRKCPIKPEQTSLVTSKEAFRSSWTTISPAACKERSKTVGAVGRIGSKKSAKRINPLPSTTNWFEGRFLTIPPLPYPSPDGGALVLILTKIRHRAWGLVLKKRLD